MSVFGRGLTYGFSTLSANSWRDRAVCVDHHPDTFTPEIDANATVLARRAHTEAILAALRICATCPVREQCLADAYETGDKWTIRGGTTGEQRVQSRRVAAIRDLQAAREVSS